MKREEIVKNIIGKIKNLYQPSKIILFGSSAWGESEKAGDVDLFIIKETHQRRRERLLTVRRIVREENGLVGIDILVYTPEEIKERLEIGDSFISQIVKKGRVVYG